MACDSAPDSYPNMSQWCCPIVSHSQPQILNPTQPRPHERNRYTVNYHHGIWSTHKRCLGPMLVRCNLLLRSLISVLMARNAHSRTREIDGVQVFEDFRRRSIF